MTVTAPHGRPQNRTDVGVAMATGEAAGGCAVASWAGRSIAGHSCGPSCGRTRPHEDKPDQADWSAKAPTGRPSTPHLRLDVLSQYLSGSTSYIQQHSSYTPRRVVELGSNLLPMQTQVVTVAPPREGYAARMQSARRSPRPLIQEGQFVARARGRPCDAHRGSRYGFRVANRRGAPRNPRHGHVRQPFPSAVWPRALGAVAFAIGLAHHRL